MPVQVVCGRKPGLRLFVCVALHGDEVAGVDFIRRLSKLSALRRLRGTLVAVPIVTDQGFGTVSSSLIALPAASRSLAGRPRAPIWLFAAGPPDRYPFEAVAR